MTTKQATSGPNRIVLFLGMILLILGLMAACVGLITALSYFQGYVVKGTRPIPGDVAKYDPIASYPQIVQFAGGNPKLLSIDMKFVKADGTLDLTADYGAEVYYYFAHVLDRSPTNASPLGAGGNPGGTYAEAITVHLVKPGMRNYRRDNYYDYAISSLTLSASPLTQTILDPPSCPLKQLWDAAIKHDAPANSVAHIEYGDYGYTFSIEGTQIHLEFDPNCQLKS